MAPKKHNTRESILNELLGLSYDTLVLSSIHKGSPLVRQMFNQTIKAFGKLELAKIYLPQTQKLLVAYDLYRDIGDVNAVSKLLARLLKTDAHRAKKLVKKAVNLAGKEVEDYETALRHIITGVLDSSWNIVGVRALIVGTATRVRLDGASVSDIYSIIEKIKELASPKAKARIEKVLNLDPRAIKKYADMYTPALLAYDNERYYKPEFIGLKVKDDTIRNIIEKVLGFYGITRVDAFFKYLATQKDRMKLISYLRDNTVFQKRIIVSGPIVYLSSAIEPLALLDPQIQQRHVLDVAASIASKIISVAFPSIDRFNDDSYVAQVKSDAKEVLLEILESQEITIDKLYATVDLAELVPALTMLLSDRGVINFDEYTGKISVPRETQPLLTRALAVLRIVSPHKLLK